MGWNGAEHLVSRSSKISFANRNSWPSPPTLQNIPHLGGLWGTCRLGKGSFYKGQAVAIHLSYECQMQAKPHPFFPHLLPRVVSLYAP